MKKIFYPKNKLSLNIVLTINNYDICEKTTNCLTSWRLAGFGNFCKKNSSFRLPYQRPSSSADCARELFNGSNRSASLVDCTLKKKFFAWGMRVFCE